MEDNLLSIYQVRICIKSVHDQIEHLTYRVVDGEISQEDIEKLKRCKEDLRDIMRYHWTINIL